MGQGLGVAELHQNTTDRIPGFIAQGPKPRASLDKFKAAVMNPPQPAVALTHRYPLSQQAPKVLRLTVTSREPWLNACIDIYPIEQQA